MLLNYCALQNKIIKFNFKIKFLTNKMIQALFTSRLRCVFTKKRYCVCMMYLFHKEEINLIAKS